MPTNINCCGECGEEGGASLKVCKSCMLVKYCNAECQKKHWPTHKIACKLRAAELRDEALFKDPPPLEDCPICFLPMPAQLVCCIPLPPATILSVPIYDFAIANEGLASKEMDNYFSCCGKSICKGCIYSFSKSGNIEKCPFCKADHVDKTDEERIKELIKRVEVNDAGAMYVLGNFYYHGGRGLMQDKERAMKLYTRAADLGYSKAHCELGNIYNQGGDLKKAKFHFETAAMFGCEASRYTLGRMEIKSGKREQCVKHWTIAASAGDYDAMNALLLAFNHGLVSRESIDSIMKSYNNSCTEMRSEARDAFIQNACSQQIISGASDAFVRFSS